MAGCLHLLDMAVLAGPADLPVVHLAQPPRSILAQQGGKTLVAETASSRERIGQVMLPMTRRLLAERRRHRHLRHDRGAATHDKAAVWQNDRSAGPRGFKSRVHAGAAGTDHEDIGLDMRRRRLGAVASNRSHDRFSFASITRSHRFLLQCTYRWTEGQSGHPSTANRFAVGAAHFRSAGDATTMPVRSAMTRANPSRRQRLDAVRQCRISRRIFYD